MRRATCSAFVISAACLALQGVDAFAGNCRDPWVTKAVTQVTGRAPNGAGEDGECSIKRYGGGKWTSYEDLVGKVRTAFGKSSLTSAAKSPPSAALGQPLKQPGTVPPGSLVGNHGGRVIGEHGAGIVANNGSRIISDNGAGMRR
jgi:hypothetical protein